MHYNQNCNFFNSKIYVKHLSFLNKLYQYTITCLLSIDRNKSLNSDNKIPFKIL